MRPAYSERLDQATLLAVRSFRGLYRKGSTVPYITHLFAVTALVGEYGGDEDQLIAAMLHDYLEDIPSATYEGVRDQFGDRVARFVLALSDTTVSPKPPWRDRKTKYLAHLRAKEPALKLISAADKLHNCHATLLNVRSQGDSCYERFNDEIADVFETKAEGVLWYYRSLVEALEEGWDDPLLEALRAEVIALHEASGAPSPW
ncbi:MAG: HD domain-containing protein [Deltaproteobacteria bacterium]|nr:HD domain-containing protein [Deltaproteobacteria bacterium]